MAFSLQGFIDNSLPTIKAAWLNAVDKMYALGQRTNAGTPITLANSQWQVTDATNNYSSMDINNQSNGILASSDVVMTADTGTDTTNYVNIGINCSGYTQAGWTVNGALDGYVYASNGNLAIGTASAKRVDFFVGGTLSANVAMTISSAGTVSLTTSPSSSDNTTKVATTAMVQAAIAAGGSAGRLLGVVNFTAQTVALSSISQASPGVITVSSAAQLPENGSPIQLTTSGTLPAPLATATTYWVVNASGTTFNVSATQGGTGINTTNAGSGTHTMNSVYVKGMLGTESYVIAIPYGAGGGSGASNASFGGSTGGGGAGGKAIHKILAASIGTTETVTIGAGGTAGSSGGASGGTGGTTSFGSHCSATGGAGSTGVGSAAPYPGGAGGLGAIADTVVTGDLILQGASGNNGSGAGSTVMPGNGGASDLGGNGVSSGAGTGSLSGVAGRNNSASGASGASGNSATNNGAIGGSGRCLVYVYS